MVSAGSLGFFQKSLCLFFDNIYTFFFFLSHQLEIFKLCEIRVITTYIILVPLTFGDGLPRWLRVKNPNLSANAGDTDLIPGSGRSPGVGNGNPFQYSWVENSMDREAWKAGVHEVAKSQTQLSTHIHLLG